MSNFSILYYHNITDGNRIFVFVFEIQERETFFLTSHSPEQAPLLFSHSLSSIVEPLLETIRL